MTTKNNYATAISFPKHNNLIVYNGVPDPLTIEQIVRDYYQREGYTENECEVMTFEEMLFIKKSRESRGESLTIRELKEEWLMSVSEYLEFSVIYEDTINIDSEWRG